MKKILIVLGVLLLLVACGGSDDFGLGKYSGRTYKNDNFKLDFTIPEEFSFLTSDELLSINENNYNLSQNKEVAQYRNVVLNISHTDGTKMVAYVDSQPETVKNAKTESINYLNFLSENDVDYSYKEEIKEINGIDFVQVDIKLPFNKLQRNYIGVNKNKVINIQVYYDLDTVSSAEKLFEMYE